MCSVSWLLLVKLSVLGNWLARKTHLTLVTYLFMCLYCLPAIRDIFHTPMARCSLFVLKILLNNKQPNNCIEYMPFFCYVAMMNTASARWMKYISVVVQAGQEHLCTDKRQRSPVACDLRDVSDAARGTSQRPAAADGETATQSPQRIRTTHCSAGPRESIAPRSYHLRSVHCNFSRVFRGFYGSWKFMKVLEFLFLRKSLKRAQVLESGFIKIRAGN